MPPKVDVKTCEGCGNCVAVCPSAVFELEGGKSKVVNPDACTSCGLCVSNCPSNSITLS